MLGKKKTASLLIIFVLVCAAVASAAPSYINKLGLDRDGSFTVLTIEGSGPLRYAHQSVEAKEGKPFRIVLDCLASRHGLPQKEYDDLPGSIIKSIRSSQFSINPEEVVRVVMDLNEESVYRVEAEGNSIRVLVSDQKTAPFANWSSTTVKPQPVAKTVPTVKLDKPAVSQKKTPSIKKKQVAKATTGKTKTITKPIADKPKTVAKITSSKPQPVVPSTARKPSVVTRKEKKTSPAINASPYVIKPQTPDKNDKYGPVLATAAKAPTKQTVTSSDEKPIVKQPSTPKTPIVASGTISKDNPVASKTVQPKVEKKAVPEKPKQQPVVAKVKPVQKSQPTIKKDLAKDSIEKARMFAALANGSVKAPDPGVNTGASGPEHKDVHKSTPTAKAQKPVASKSESKPAKTVVKKSTPQPVPVTKNNEVVLASVDKVSKKPAAPSKDKVEKIRTSKYRRESAKSAEMKSSQVVQFPQRMVIKYKRPSKRDPFESLITVEKKKGNIDLNKVPNVETLNLVGILEPESGKGAALMEDLNGIGYILHPGDRVKNGYVAQVDKTAIYFQINEYGWGRTVVKHMEKDN